MAFRLDIDTDNAAFADEPHEAIADILREQVIPRLRQGDDEHWVRDVNGNKIGSWTLEHVRPCQYCGEQLDTDCFGELRCPDCDGPCPGCWSGPAPGDPLDAALWADLLEDLPTLTQGQALDLKVDTGELRVWLARTSLEDGEPFARTVYVEEYRTVYVGEELRDRWVDVGHYDGDEYGPMPWPQAAAEAYGATFTAVARHEGGPQ